MEEKTLKALDELKQAMAMDERFINLKIAEERMINDEEVKTLSKNKELKEEEYETSLSRFGNKSELTLASQKKLYEAKLALDSHPLVKEYTAAYIKVRDIVNLIDDLLFFEYRNHKGGCR